MLFDTSLVAKHYFVLKYFPLTIKKNHKNNRSPPKQNLSIFGILSPRRSRFKGYEHQSEGHVFKVSFLLDRGAPTIKHRSFCDFIACVRCPKLHSSKQTTLRFVENSHKWGFCSFYFPDSNHQNYRSLGFNPGFINRIFSVFE